MSITIQKSKIKKQGGVVILSIKEYQKLLANSIPTYYLAGSEAGKLDKLVEQGLKEYRAGKTRRIFSLADLD